MDPWWRHQMYHGERDGLTAISWWRHQMETFSALLAICAGNSPVTGEFSAQRPVRRSFDVFFDLRPNKRLSKQSWGWWFDTPSRPLWCHWNVLQKSHDAPVTYPTIYHFVTEMCTCVYICLMDWGICEMGQIINLKHFVANAQLQFVHQSFCSSWSRSPVLTHEKISYFRILDQMSSDNIGDLLHHTGK